jgi:DHA1 family tetracycline resistance protein-like MFS transporter
MSALALLVAAVRLRESLPAERRAAAPAQPGRLQLIRRAFGRERLRPLLILFFINTFAFAGMETTFGQWAYARFGWGPSQVGSVFGGLGVMLILIQGGLIGRLSKKYGEARLLFAGTLLLGLGMAGMAVSGGPALGILACGVLAVGQGLASPATGSLVSRTAGSDEQGSILGVNQSMGAAARFFGPAAAGLAFEGYGAGGPYWLGAGVMLLAALLAWRVLRDRVAPAAALPGVARHGVR